MTMPPGSAPLDPPPPLEPPPPPPFARAMDRPPPRPVAITVIAICGIIWASIALISSVLGLVVFFVPAGMPNPVLDAMRQSRGLMTYTLVATAAAAALAAMLLAGSIGSLSLRPWARRMLVRWSVAAVILAIISQVVNWVWVQPVVEEAQRQQNLPPAMLLASRVMGICGAAVVGVIGPLVVLYFMTRPNVKAAFEENAAATAPPAP